MGCLVLAVSPHFDALKLCFETQFICLQLEDVPIFIPGRIPSLHQTPSSCLWLWEKWLVCYLLWVYSSCRWFRNGGRMDRSWRPSRLLRVSCDRVGMGSCPPAWQKSRGSLKHWPATIFAQPWLCRKREEIIFFTLLSCLKRLRLGNWVGCLAIDLEIKLFFVHLWCLWLCTASAPRLG